MIELDVAVVAAVGENFEGGRQQCQPWSDVDEQEAAVGTWTSSFPAEEYSCGWRCDFPNFPSHCYHCEIN